MSAWSVGADGLNGWERGRRAAVPAIHVAGWYDVFSDTQLAAFTQVSKTPSWPRSWANFSLF
jgi:predicted acyl esterase